LRRRNRSWEEAGAEKERRKLEEWNKSLYNITKTKPNNKPK
jgi:hypothetical protein